MVQFFSLNFYERNTVNINEPKKKIFKLQSHQDFKEINNDPNFTQIQLIDDQVETTLNNNISNENIDNLIYYNKFMFLSQDKSKIYVLAIIDYLQVYHFLKSLETNYKNLFSHSHYSISCIPPDVYQERFIKYIESITINYFNEHAEDYIEDKSDKYYKFIENVKLCPNCGHLQNSSGKMGAFSKMIKLNENPKNE